MNRNSILHLLQNENRQMLQKNALDTLLGRKGRHVFIRGLIEFSNICRRNCLYCGLRAQNTRLPRYCLEADDILAGVGNAVRAGADSIVLQSGEGAADAHWLAEIVREIRLRHDVAITLSVGECNEDDFALWRASGASRYLLKHETADAGLYARLHPGYSLKDRISCLEILGDLGFEVGSGFMIGLPGQTLESIADDILLCQRLNVAMAGVGPFIPQKSTPLASCSRGSPDLTLRVISILRLVIPDANLPATTALATADPGLGQRNGLMAGANVLMPNFTPVEFAANYQIYDGKNKVGIKDAARIIESCGRCHGLVVG